jgi:hypothetical protein
MTHTPEPSLHIDVMDVGRVDPSGANAGRRHLANGIIQRERNPLRNSTMKTLFFYSLIIAALTTTAFAAPPRPRPQPKREPPTPQQEFAELIASKLDNYTKGEIVKHADALYSKPNVSYQYVLDATARVFNLPTEVIDIVYNPTRK